MIIKTAISILFFALQCSMVFAQHKTASTVSNSTPKVSKTVSAQSKKVQGKTGSNAKNENSGDESVEMPIFPGGLDGLRKYLSETVVYPEKAQKNGVQGVVVCEFIVETDGSINEVSVIQHVDPSLDNEAVRVVKGMPKWKPARKGNQNIRVRYKLPVTFRL